MGIVSRARGKIVYNSPSLRIEMEHQDATNLAINWDYIAEIYRMRGQYDDAMVYLEQAKTLLERSGDKREKAANLTEIGIVRKALRQHRQAIDAFLAALPIYQEIGQRLGVGLVQVELAEAYGVQGRYADAYQSLRQSLRIYEDKGLPADKADAKAHLGHLLTTLGQFDEAEENLSEATELAREARADGLVPFILLAQSRLLRLQGRTEEALAKATSAQKACARAGEMEIKVMSDVEMGLVQLALARPTDARRTLLRAMGDASESRLKVIQARATAALAEVSLVEGEAVEAQELAKEAIRVAEAFSGRPVLWAAYGILGDAYGLLRRKEESDRSILESERNTRLDSGECSPGTLQHIPTAAGRRNVVEEDLARGGRGADGPLTNTSASRLVRKKSGQRFRRPRQNP